MREGVRAFSLRTLLAGVGRRCARLGRIDQISFVNQVSAFGEKLSYLDGSVLDRMYKLGVLSRLRGKLVGAEGIPE